jgi:diacylglycerol kinase family enzyme
MIRVQRFEDLFESYHADQFVIETETPMAVLADGEPCGQIPIEVELIPQAVTLLVPDIE